LAEAKREVPCLQKDAKTWIENPAKKSENKQNVSAENRTPINLQAVQDL